MFGPKFEKVDSRVTEIDEELGRFMLSEVVASLNKRTGFGTGFPGLFRYFPAAKVTDKFVIIFDAAQQ